MVSISFPPDLAIMDNDVDGDDDIDDLRCGEPTVRAKKDDGPVVRRPPPK